MPHDPFIISHINDTGSIQTTLQCKSYFLLCISSEPAQGAAPEKLPNPAQLNRQAGTNSLLSQCLSTTIQFDTH